MGGSRSNSRRRVMDDSNPAPSPHLSRDTFCLVQWGQQTRLSCSIEERQAQGAFAPMQELRERLEILRERVDQMMVRL